MSMSLMRLNTCSKSLKRYKQNILTNACIRMHACIHVLAQRQQSFTTPLPRGVGIPAILVLVHIKGSAALLSIHDGRSPILAHLRVCIRTLLSRLDQPGGRTLAAIHLYCSVTVSFPGMYAPTGTCFRYRNTEILRQNDAASHQRKFGVSSVTHLPSCRARSRNT